MADLFGQGTTFSMTARARRAVLLSLAVTVLVWSFGAAPVVMASGNPVRPTSVSIERLIGAKLMVTMAGRSPSSALLDRVRRGEIGGVVLLGINITSPDQLDRLTRRLQRAAQEGGQPPLLIAVDQEGGSVKRIPWAPPTITVPEMGRRDSTDVARAQGRKTGTALAARGVTVDLAPVADIPISTDSFMYQQGRTFSFRPARTARLSTAFAEGLAASGTIATMKHFPGIGRAESNTDRAVATISATRPELDTDLRPYRRAIAAGIPMIMLSNATYTALDPENGAGWSRAIAHTLLREELGFTGVSITDSLNGTAAARDLLTRDLALRAAIAGTDMILMTSSEASSASTFRFLVRKAQEGHIPLDRLTASYARIQALRAGPVVVATPPIEQVVAPRWMVAAVRPRVD